MGKDGIDSLREYREKMNEKLAAGDRVIRFPGIIIVDLYNTIKK